MSSQDYQNISYKSLYEPKMTVPTGTQFMLN